MLDHNLKKYTDFKNCLEEYFRGEMDKDDILHYLESVQQRYDKEHATLLENLERNQTFYLDNKDWIETLRDAFANFEEARDIIEDAIREGSDDISEALTIFREGNVLMNEVGMDLEEMVERTDFRQIL